MAGRLIEGIDPLGSESMDEQIRKPRGANMDIDLATPRGEIPWEQDRCPWNEDEHTDEPAC